MKKIVFILFLAILGLTSQAQHIRVNQNKATGEPIGKIVVTDGSNHLKIDTTRIQYLWNKSQITPSDTARYGAGGAYLTDSAYIKTHVRTDLDKSITNEIQNISTNGNAGNITISSGSTLNLNVNDADSSTSNELNTSALYDKTTRIFSVTDSGGAKGDTIPNSTTIIDGLMSAIDKANFDSITTGTKPILNIGATSSTVIKYGYLYNWYAATDARNISAVGWHVPTRTELEALQSFVGYSEGGGSLKETGFTYWDSPNTGATNSTGFNARGSGLRLYTGGFSSKLILTDFWSSTQLSADLAWQMQLFNSFAVIQVGDDRKGSGIPIRLIADSGTPSSYTGNDGKVYRTVTINGVTYVADNLAETKYRNGDYIHGYEGGVYTPISNANWAALTTEGMTAYDDLESNAIETVTTSNNIALGDTLHFDSTIIGNASLVDPLRVDTTLIGTKYDLSLKVTKNAPIAAATNTKITYDAKGLVTGSTSATASDIVNISSGTVTGTTVQLGINELDAEKVPYTGATANVDLGTMALRTGYIDLVQRPNPIHSAYRLFADTTAHTLGFYNDEADITMQIGSEMWSRIYNDSGTNKLNGTVVRITGSNGDTPTVNLASNDNHITADGVLGVATHDIETNTYGFITTIGEVHGLNTSACPEGAILYLGVNGVYTHIRPVAPNFVIEIGTCLYSHATDGTIMVNIKGSPYDITHNSFNDIFLESMKFTVTSNGTTTTGNLERNGGGDLTMQFSSGFSTLDCTPASTVVLTAGSATVPQTNYVYVPKSTGVLTVSTSGWPSDEHIKVSQVACRTSALTQADGVLRNQNWNDHIAGSNGSGHVSHINERIRKLNAEWDSGIAPTFTVVSAATPDNLYFSSTEGYVYQMHKQLFAAQSMPTADIHIVNHFTTPFVTTTNLNNQLLDALGATMESKAYSLVIWGVQNETGEASHLMCNLPIGSYLSAANAIQDASNYSVYTIPNQFKGVGFLIARITLSHNPASSGTWTLEQVQDLRGYFPNNTAGGGSSGSGGGVTTYLGLTDTPNSYASSANKLQGVNSGETAIESKGVTATLAGTLNIPTGQQYQINGGSIIVDAINDAVTTTAPSQNAVFDAIATVTTLADKVKYNASDASSGYLADKIVAGTGISLAEGIGGDADRLVITSTATGGSGEIWTALTGTYATATTFTITGTDKDVGLLELSLLTCTDAAGTTRRIGYVKTATNNSGTITCNIVTDTDLASGDKDFKIAYNRKITDYMRLVTIPGEQIADASYSQGMFYADIQSNSYLLPIDLSVQIAAAGAGSALTVNIYKNTTALFSSAPDMTTNTVLRSQRPTTNTISAAETVSLRIMSSAGATNKAADFQAKLYIVPQSIYTSF